LNNPTLTPGVPAQIRMLADLRDGGKFGASVNLVFRLHPWDRDESGYRDVLQGRPRTCVERPFAASNSQSVYESLPRPEDVLHYGALLQHADALVNVASTTSLDAIAVDCPVVNFAFDTVPVVPQASIGNYYGYAHYKPIVDSGAVEVAYTSDELAEALRNALVNRSAGTEARAAARRHFLHFEDGHNYRRVADRVWQVMRGRDARD
jgi:CDP-glycerol glycerophosphotransferase (TagB/SpsB family)